MSGRICRQLPRVSLSFPLSATAQSCDIHALRGSSSRMSEKCLISSSHVNPPSAQRSGLNIGSGASLSKDPTLSGRLCEPTRRRDCVELESMNAEGTWYDGTWNDWCWKTPDHWSSSSSSTPQAYSWTWHDWEHSPWSNQWNSPVDTQWNSPVGTTSSDLRQYGASVYSSCAASWPTSLSQGNAGSVHKACQQGVNSTPPGSRSLR